MPFTLTQILSGLVLPAVLLAIGMALAWQPWNRRAKADARCMMAPLTALAFLITYRAFQLPPGWPPTFNINFLVFYFAIVCGIAGMADAIFKPPAWLRAIILLLIWRIAIRYLLARQVPEFISGTDCELWIDATSLFTVSWWLIFERLSERSPGVTTPLVLALVSIGAAIVEAMGWDIIGSAAMCGGLVALSVAAAVLAFWNNRICFSRGFAQTVVLILQFILIHGYFYTGQTLGRSEELCFALLLASPLLVFLADLPPLRFRRPLPRFLARAVPVLLLIAFVCAATIRQGNRAETDKAQMQDE